MYPSPSPRAHRIDPTQFMLSKEDRKLSAPVFSMAHQHENRIEDHPMIRSPEVENIPEKVHDTQDEAIHFFA